MHTLNDSKRKKHTEIQKLKRLNKLTQVKFSHPNLFDLNKIRSSRLGKCRGIVNTLMNLGILPGHVRLSPNPKSIRISTILRHSPMQLISVRANMTMHTTMKTNKNRVYRVYLLFFALTNFRKIEKSFLSLNLMLPLPLSS